MPTQVMPAQEWSRGQAHVLRKVQIVEELTACAGAFYNLYLVDVNASRRDVRGTACSFHHETTPGLEAKSLLDGVLLCIGHIFSLSGVRLGLGFVGTILVPEQGYQMAKESDDSFIMSPHQAVALTPVGRSGESRTQAGAWLNLARARSGRISL